MLIKTTFANKPNIAIDHGRDMNIKYFKLQFSLHISMNRKE